MPDTLSNPSRRTIVTGAGAAAAAACCPLHAVAAKTGTIIDTHHHFYPPSFIAKRRADILAVSRGYAEVLDWTPARSLAAMDAAGVRKAILSISTPGVWLGSPEDSKIIARECNEYAASLARSHPNRFGFFAALPLPDKAGALAEIAYAFDVLGANGAVLLTNYNNRYLGDAAFAEVLAELDRRNAVIFLHPTVGDCCRNLVPELPPAFIEFTTDTTRTAASLLFTGTLARLPSLRFIFSHGGGTLPMLTGRMGMWLGKDQNLLAQYPNGLGGELARHYYDVVSVSSPPAVTALKRFVPMGRLLFGSDYPYGEIKPLLANLAAFELNDDEQAMLLGGNARTLLNL